MKSLFRNPYQSKQVKATKIFLIGDDSASKESFYSHLDLITPEEGQEIAITIKQLS